MLPMIAKRAFRLVAVLAAAAGVITAALVWQLSRAPVALPFLAPRIEEALAAIAPGAIAHVGHVELAWVHRRPVIRVFDLRVVEPDGSQLASLPALALRPSIRAALRGRLATAWIGITGVRLALVRDAEGRFALDTGEDGQSDTTARLLARLLASHNEGKAASYLSRIDVRSADLKLDDRAARIRWRAEGAAFVLGFAPKHLTARLQGVIALESDENAFIRRLRLPLRAAADAALGKARRIDAVAFELHAAHGNAVVPADTEQTIALEALDVEGRYSAEQASLELRRVHVVRAATRLDATARIPLDAFGVVEADGTLRSLPAQDLTDFWPPTLQQKTRRWIEDNVHEGMVTSSRFRLRIPKTREPGPLPIEAFGVQFEFEDLAVSFMKHFEPLKGMHGSAALTAARFAADVTSATSANLELRDGRIDIDLRQKPAQATITAAVSGTTPDILAVIDQPPLDIPKKLGITPAAAGGSGQVHLGLRLPLASGTTSKDVRIQADATLNAASHSDLRFGISISDADLQVTVNDGRVAVQGDTDVKNAPLVGGRVHVDFVVEPRDVGKRVKGTLAGDEFFADGLLTFGPDGLRDAVFSTLRSGRSKLSAHLLRNQAGHCTVSLAGEILDLEPLFERPEGGTEEPSKLPRPGWDADVRVTRLLTGRELELSDVEGDVRGEAGDIRELHASGGLAGGGTFRTNFIATSTGARFDATSDNGGRLLEHLGVDLHVQGGRLFVSGSSGGAGSNRRVEGDLELEEFRVVQAPILAEILNLGSLEGIESMLRRDGIAFTHARIPFVWSHAGFEFREARAVGGIGLTGDGTFDSNRGEIDVTGQVIPAYSLNSALGKIPLIGHLLVGGEGQGVFGINYRVGGNREKPEVSVNPLSALTPGILRQMFVDPFTRKPEALKHKGASPPSD